LQWSTYRPLHAALPLHVQPPALHESALIELHTPTLDRPRVQSPSPLQDGSNGELHPLPPSTSQVQCGAPPSA
jgi:hypothetical protein